LKALRWTCLLVMLLLLCGCSLLPVEEELPQAPLINTLRQDNFTLGYVERGDLVRIKRFSATYSAVREERLSFSIGGLIFKDILVRVGDTVTAGDPLIQLDQSNLSDQLTDIENSIDSLHLSIRQLEQDRDLAMEEQEIRLSYLDEDEQASAASPAEAARSYDKRLRELNDQLHIARMQRETIQAEMEKRVLRAGMDGTISYLRVLRDTDVSSVGEHLVTISDPSSSMFVVKVKEEELPLFTPGMQLSVTVRSDSYPVTVLDPTQLSGAQPQENTVYLLPDEKAALLLESGNSGSLELELDRREDCLYVNAGAVKTMQGQSFVYYQDENGLRSMKTVVTGFETDAYIEIVSGLAQGEAYIIK